MRYHFTPVRMAALKRQQHVLERMWKKGTLAHCWWECKLMPPLWKQHRASFKNEKNRITIWSSNPTPGYFSEEHKKHKFENIHTPLCSYSQDTEATVHWWINGQIKCDIHSWGLLLSHNKEWNLATCDNTDGPGGQYAKRNKSGYQRQISCDFTYV